MSSIWNFLRLGNLTFQHLFSAPIRTKKLKCQNFSPNGNFEKFWKICLSVFDQKVHYRFTEVTQNALFQSSSTLNNIFP